MKVGSLFSGIGGFDLGLERVGMSVAWQVEKDRDCLRVLSSHYPDVERFTNVKEVGRRNLGPVDLLCGGFPCQDLSVAGKRAGLAGERSGLWFEFKRIIGELMPQWVLIENVPGLLSSNGGRDFRVILQGLARLGYHAAWRVFDSQYFGVPQRRRRVFIVASLGSGRCAEILFEPSCGCWDSPPSREAGEGFARDVAPSLSASGRGTSRAGESRGQDPLVVAFNHKSGGDFRPSYSFDIGNTLQACQTQAVAFGGNRQSGSLDVATACNAHGGTGRHDFESETFLGAPPLTHNPYGDHESREGLLTVAFSPGLVRRLTPTECLRLQGFPDDWLDLDPPLSDSAKYRMVGNAVTVNVIEWIGRRMLAA